MKMSISKIWKWNENLKANMALAKWRGIMKSLECHLVMRTISNGAWRWRWRPVKRVWRMARWQNQRHPALRICALSCAFRAARCVESAASQAKWVSSGGWASIGNLVVKKCRSNGKLNENENVAKAGENDIVKWKKERNNNVIEEEERIVMKWKWLKMT